MSFDPQLIANQLVQELLPAGINNVTTCMTRLRFNVKAAHSINNEKIKAIPGILGIIEAENEFQVIIGPGKVNQVYDLIIPLLAQQEQLHQHELTKNSDTLPEEIKAHFLLSKMHFPAIKNTGSSFKLLLKKIANIFIPLIPAFIGCGLILGLFNLLNKGIAPELLGGVSFDKTAVGVIFTMIGSGITVGMMLFVGINTAREFGGTPILGGVLATVMNLPALSTINLFGTPGVPGRGGVIAVLLVVISTSLLERYLRRIIPSSLDLFLTPTLVLLFGGFGAIYILQPIGGILANFITTGVQLAIIHGGIVSGFILSTIFLPLVITGLHQGLIPIHAQLIAATGVTILLPILAMAGAGQVGAALGVWFKTRNQKLRHIIKSSIAVGFLGIGEPLIYGVTLPLFTPFIAACIGGGIGGAFVASFKLGATGIGLSGLPLALLINNGVLLYLAGIVLAYLGGFILTLLMGFSDDIFDDVVINEK